MSNTDKKYSTDLVDDAANKDIHRLAARINKSGIDAGRLYSLGRHIESVIKSARGRATEIRELLDKPGNRTALKSQPYGEEFIAAAETEADTFDQKAESLKSLQAEAEAIIADAERGAGMLGVINRRVKFGDREAPENHAQLLRGMDVAECAQVVYDAHSDVWGVVGGWQWTAKAERVKVSQPGSRSETMRRENVFLAPKGKPKAAVLAFSRMQYDHQNPAGETGAVAAIADILDKEEIDVLRSFGSYGRKRANDYNNQEAPSEATTAKIAAALGVESGVQS